MSATSSGEENESDDSYSAWEGMSCNNASCSNSTTIQSRESERSTSDDKSYYSSNNTPPANAVAVEDELLPLNCYDDDNGFGFMGDQPSVALTPVEQVVVEHAPLVHATMVLRHKQRHVDVAFSVGDIVTVAVRKEDRSSSDFSRFFCRISSNPHGRFYELKCKSGTLCGLLPSSDLQDVPPKVATHYRLVIPLDGPRRLVSLTAAAQLVRTGPSQAVTCK
jgi:hypothetical protein